MHPQLGASEMLMLYKWIADFYSKPMIADFIEVYERIIRIIKRRDNYLCVSRPWK